MFEGFYRVFLGFKNSGFANLPDAHLIGFMFAFGSVLRIFLFQGAGFANLFFLIIILGLTNLGLHKGAFLIFFWASGRQTLDLARYFFFLTGTKTSE